MSNKLSCVIKKAEDTELDWTLDGQVLASTTLSEMELFFLAMDSVRLGSFRQSQDLTYRDHLLDIDDVSTGLRISSTTDDEELTDENSVYWSVWRSFLVNRFLYRPSKPPTCVRCLGCVNMAVIAEDRNRDEQSRAYEIGAILPCGHIIGIRCFTRLKRGFETRHAARTSGMCLLCPVKDCTTSLIRRACGHVIEPALVPVAEEDMAFKYIEIDDYFQVPRCGKGCA
jgi:hypothetical protein